MLIPDSLASLEASSTRSVGQPSTITTTTLGAPPRFPLASKKKFLLTNESAFPAIEEELRRSYRFGSTLSDNIPWNNRQRADSSVGGCGELGKAVSVAVWAGEETTATGASASCTEHPPYASERLGMVSWVIKDPQSIDGSCPQGDRYVLQFVMDLQCLGISTCRSWWEQWSLTSPALGLSTFGPSLCILWGGVGLLQPRLWSPPWAEDVQAAPSPTNIGKSPFLLNFLNGIP